MIDTVTSRYGSGNTIQISDLLHLPNPDPPETHGSTWQPLPHIDLVNGLLDEIHSRSWHAELVTLTTSNDKADVAGCMRLVIPEFPSPEGLQWSLGFVNSNVQRRSLTLYLGGITTDRVGVVFAKTSRNKHTSGFHLYDELTRMLDQFLKTARETPELITTLQHHRLTPYQANELILIAGRRSVVPWSRLKIVDELYWSGPNTTWSLLLALSQAIRLSPPLDQMEQLLKAFRLCHGG